MTHGGGRSDPGIVAERPANKAEPSAAESGEAKDGDQGECGPTKHTPGTGLGKCVTCAGPHTTSCKAKEEGKVHLASSPRQCRSAQAIVFRTQEGRGTGGRRPGMAGLRDKPRGQP